MIYRRIRSTDLPQVNRLLKAHWGQEWDGTQINSRDVALGAFSDHGACHGVVWAGLMQKNRLAYIDYYLTDPAFARRGVGRGLGKALVEAFHKLGVERCFGAICTDEFHDRSAINALRIGMGAKALPYTLVYGKLSEMGRELDHG